MQALSLGLIVNRVILYFDSLLLTTFDAKSSEARDV
jgi:hypothetical protein